MNMVKNEVGQLEKALNALVHRPRLIRRDYWTSQIECPLGRPGLSAQDQGERPFGAQFLNFT
jgi:hypothetical protein